MKIKIGISTNGDIYADLEEAKVCNFCIYFKGYGLHVHSGHCFKLDKDIEGGYIGNYSKVAKKCVYFEVKAELLEKKGE